MNIPANYQTVMPYLIIPDAKNFIVFTQKVFDAKETCKTMRDENTSTEVYSPRPAGLFMYVEDADETYKKAIDAGATIITELADEPYGRSGGVADPFGNSWWITSVK